MKKEWSGSYNWKVFEPGGVVKRFLAAAADLGKGGKGGGEA
jgi:hypothetical protein